MAKPRQEEEEPIDWQKDFGMKDAPKHSDGQHVVEIWGKAAIGEGWR